MPFFFSIRQWVSSCVCALASPSTTTIAPATSFWLQPCTVSRGRQVGSPRKYLREPAEPSYFILGTGQGLVAPVLNAVTSLVCDWELGCPHCHVNVWNVQQEPWPEALHHASWGAKAQLGLMQNMLRKVWFGGTVEPDGSLMMEGHQAGMTHSITDFPAVAWVTSVL